MIFSVDPGLNHCGLAIWERGTNEAIYYLAHADLVRAPKDAKGAPERISRWEAIASEVWRSAYKFLERSPNMMEDSLLIEVPQVYRQSKGDPNDLIDLAGVVGAIVGKFQCEEWGPNPKDWKGQIPKEVTADRVARALNHEEWRKIQKVPASLMHNVLDAIHLGLVYLQRNKLR